MVPINAQSIDGSKYANKNIWWSTDHKTQKTVSL